MSISQRLQPILVFALLSLLLVILWFKDGLMFAGGEEGVPFYNLTNNMGLISSVWYEVEAGYPLTIFLPRIPYISLLAFLSKTGVSEIFLQAATFFTLMFTGTVSFYFLIKETIGSSLRTSLRERVSIVSGIFYLLNPYIMTQVWGRGLYALFFSFALVPLFLLLNILGLKRKKFHYAILATLATFFLSPAFVMVTQVVVVWIPFLFYFLFHLSTSKRKKDKLFDFAYLIFLITTWVFVHAWWLIPTFKIGSQVFSIRSGNLKENLGTLRGVSAYFPISYVLRLMQKYYFFVAKAYGEIYSTFIFQLISLLIPIMALFSVSYLKRIKFLRYFGILFLIGLFVSLGANPPFGRIFIWFFTQIPQLQAFRNPYEKFGLVFLLSYVPFFALGLVRLSKIVVRRFSNLFLIIAIFIICVIFVWPIWTRDFAGINAWIKVPNYYKEADSWLTSKDGDFRIIHFPLIPGSGVKYNWKYPYQGVEPSGFLFTTRSIGRNVALNKVFYNVLLQRFGNFSPGKFGPDPDISNSEFKGKELWEELARLNVRYIVLHKDLDYELAGSKSQQETEQFLSEQEGIQKVKSFGELDVYEVNIPDNISLIYSPTVEVEYKKVNPTKYVATVNNARAPFDLYFLSEFDDGWEAYVDSEEIDTHIKVFSYANRWKVNKNGSYNVLIKYAPQDTVVRGWQITGYSLLVLLAILIVKFNFKRKKRG